MKHLRRLCLAVTLAIVVSSQGLLLADGQCCQGFVNHCTSFCSTHGGVLMTDCLQATCTDYCICSDIDPGTQQHYIDSHSSPPWCECEGGGR